MLKIILHQSFAWFVCRFMWTAILQLNFPHQAFLFSAKFCLLPFASWSLRVDEWSESCHKPFVGIKLKCFSWNSDGSPSRSSPKCAESHFGSCCSRSTLAIRCIWLNRPTPKPRANKISPEAFRSDESCSLFNLTSPSSEVSSKN